MSKVGFQWGSKSHQLKMRGVINGHNMHSFNDSIWVVWSRWPKTPGYKANTVTPKTLNLALTVDWALEKPKVYSPCHTTPRCQLMWIGGRLTARPLLMSVSRVIGLGKAVCLPPRPRIKPPPKRTWATTIQWCNWGNVSNTAVTLSLFWWFFCAVKNYW